MAKTLISPEVRAQILAGATEIDLGEQTPAGGTTAATPAPAPAATTPPAPAAPAPAPVADVTAFLTNQLAAKDADLLKANVEIAQLKAAAVDASDSMPGLLAIAQSVIGQMQVALGNADTSAALSAKDAVTEHARVQPVYKAKFPVGGVAKAGEADTDPPEAKVHPLFAERLRTLNTAK